MPDHSSNLMTWKPGRFFYFGLAIVLLANWLPFIPGWYTFVHMWRVEMAASIFLACVLGGVWINRKKIQFVSEIDPGEWKFVVLPILAFITWSFLSSVWATSWKSAIHHSLIWAQYLLFYFIFRELARRTANLHRIVTLFALTIAFYAVPEVVEYCALLTFGGQSTLGMRYAKYGEQVVTILPIVLVLIVQLRGRKFLIGATLATLSWLLIFCSFGRINYLLFACGVVASFACLVVSSKRRRYVPKFAVVVLLFILAPLPLHLFSGLSNDGGTGVPILDRVSNAEGMASSNNFRKLMMSVSSEMISAHPVIGIGADNFGMQVNRYREIYGAAHPEDINLASAEDQLPERAHNEFLQIVAELGIVGGLLVSWLFVGILLIAFRTLRFLRAGSINPIAAVIGIGMFLVSSLVSAYSFRVMQNGVVFFFVLAVAARYAFARNADALVTTDSKPVRWLRPAIAAGLFVCFGLAAYSALRVTSVIVTSRANTTAPLSSASSTYDLAMRLDDENPDVRQNLGMRLFRKGRYKEAVPYLQSAVMMGRAPSAEISYLATAQSLSGDNNAAEQTMAYAVRLYPRSPFVLTRYSTVLEQNGKTAEASDAYAQAMAIDPRSAITWRELIVSGPKALSDRAARDPNYAHVMDLWPKNSIYAVVTERLIRYPEEQVFSFAKLTTEED